MGKDQALVLEDGLEEDIMFKLAIEYNYIFDQFAL